MFRSRYFQAAHKTRWRIAVQANAPLRRVTKSKNTFHVKARLFTLTTLGANWRLER